MSRKRFIVVFILLVVILLVASALFGVLTYGLNTQKALDPTPEPEVLDQWSGQLWQEDPVRIVLANSSN